ncbi:MAG TPA: response regulator [Chitinophagaceae bacterium]|nr:response regulator [Chitinophagaceae bacterium]
MANTATLQKKAARKALVVEDEGEMGLLLNIFLDEREVELDYVKDLLSAGEYLENRQPAIVILDNKLPDGFGVDFINYIRKKYPAIKILMISGFASVKDVALQNGADAFLEKPFTKIRLQQTLNELL